MAVSDRGKKIYEIDPNSFSNICIKNYIRTYFKEGSLNVATSVPTLVLKSNPDWVVICFNDGHPFYNLFRELSKDNEDLYNYYFKEKYANKAKNLVELKINGENIQNVKQFCKLDIKVRIVFKEGILYDDSDPQYFDEWRFLLDLNKIEFV